MRTIPFVRWIANAAARFTGPHGAVTDQAQQTGCSRQCVYDHSQKVLAAVEAQHGGGPTREQLIQAERGPPPRKRPTLGLAVPDHRVPPGQATGVRRHRHGHGLEPQPDPRSCWPSSWAPRRLPVARPCIAGSRPPAPPPARVLKRLDQAARTLVLVGCLDEIFFHRRPVLVGVEPQSMVWFLGKKAANAKGRPGSASSALEALRRVVCDAGPDCRRASPRASRIVVRTRRVGPAGEGPGCLPHQAGGPAGLETPLESAGTALGAGRGGQPGRRPSPTAGPRQSGPGPDGRIAWTKAEAAFHRYEQAEAAWRRPSRPWACFVPMVNSTIGRGPSRSPRPCRACRAGMVQGPWVPQAPESLTFLDRLHARWANSGWRRSCSTPWWLVVAASAAARGGDPARGGYRQVAPLVQQVLCQQLDPNWRESYRQVAAVLGRAVRASSAVECMNSVLRMHQCRHRTLTQGMLDLKRLYWNTREFRRREAAGPLPV